MLPHLMLRLKKQITQHIDMPLLAIVMMLMTLGLATVHSATIGGQARFLSQFLNMSLGLLLMWGIAQVSPQRFMHYAVPLYLLGILLLVLVFPFGVVVNGARRWLSLGVTRIQPSEILKIATPLMLAWYFQKYEGTLRACHFVIGCLLLLLPFLLVAKQPDLGTAILVGSAGFSVLFFAGLSWKILLALAGFFAVTVLPFLWLLFTKGAQGVPFIASFLHPYQIRRIQTLFDPASDPLGAGYHIIQSTIAIGSGGTGGKGWLEGTQTHLEFIPERHTDFIFAVFSEEWGFMGGLVLILLYLLLIARGLMITARASTLFSRTLAGAITLNFFTYVFVNIGMVSGILPVVGVPLPFISYGGTALVVIFLGVGILMSISSHRMLMTSK